MTHVSMKYAYCWYTIGSFLLEGRSIITKQFKGVYFTRGVQEAEGEELNNYGQPHPANNKLAERSLSLVLLSYFISKLCMVVAVVIS